MLGSHRDFIMHITSMGSLTDHGSMLSRADIVMNEINMNSRLLRIFGKDEKIPMFVL
jgi:hypothetical protein